MSVGDKERVKEAIRMLDAHIEYANKTKKFNDAGNFEFLKRLIIDLNKGK